MMTLNDALAVYLYFLEAEGIEVRDEQVLDAAWKIIERRALETIEALSKRDPPQ